LRFGYSDFPYPVFLVLWLVPAVSVLAVAPLIRSIRAGETVLTGPGTLVARAGVLVLLALFWALVVSDQMPCFLGVPNCD
jgi:hypothetical protein